MANQKIDAPRITKPIQLLAAWLIGLVLVDGIFLSATTTIGDHWSRSLLIVAAVLNVPGFLFAIFLLQTKFRPELQEDVFYSRYISKKTSSQSEVNKLDVLSARVTELGEKIAISIESLSKEDADHTYKNIDWSRWKVAINNKLPFYENAREKFASARIPIEVVFGEGANDLKSYDVSISEEIGSQHVLALLKIISDLPFDRFNFWHPLREVGENEDVYIGSYGGDEDPIILTDTVRAAILAAKDAIDLNKIRSGG